MGVHIQLLFLIQAPASVYDSTVCSGSAREWATSYSHKNFPITKLKCLKTIKLKQKVTIRCRQYNIYKYYLKQILT